MEQELTGLREENERQKIIINALVQQNKQLTMLIKQHGLPVDDEMLLNRTAAINNIYANGYNASETSNHKNKIGYNEAVTSFPQSMIGCNEIDTSNTHYKIGCNEGETSNHTDRIGYNDAITSSHKGLPGYNQTVASNQTPLTGVTKVNTPILIELLRKNGIGHNMVSLESSAAILSHCYYNTDHSYHKLMALTGFSEGGVTKRLIALKQSQLLYRSGKQQYTLTPKAAAILQQAMVPVTAANK